MTEVRVAAFQAPLLPPGAIDRAVALIADRVRWCEVADVQILCCPEAVLGGLADYAGSPVDVAIGSWQLEAVLAPLASDSVATIVGFTETDSGGALYNAAAVYHRGAVVDVYRKHHPAINRSVYTAGDATPVFTIAGLTFGIVICRDSSFEEPARTIIEQGATVLFVPTNNAMPPGKGGAELVAEARASDIARARMNGVYVVRADVAGRAGNSVCHGSSAIVSPDGLAVMPAHPGEPDLIVVEMDSTAQPRA